MHPRLTALAQSLRHTLGARLSIAEAPSRRSVTVFVLLAAGALGVWTVVKHPPLVTVEPGAVAVRTNTWSGRVDEFGDGSVFVLPGLHQARTLTLRDQSFKPQQGRKATGEAPFQSVEGLSLGVDLAVRYAIDPQRVVQVARTLPPDIGRDVVEPTVQGVVYRVFSGYTVREIFSSKRGEIQQAIEAELKTQLGAEGLVVKGVQFGQVDLPAEYRAGLDRLLAEELENDKMRYTLELKEQRVKQSELEAQADKVRRETAANAAASEQVIAAKAQEEAMRHVLPFKQKQIEQRKLEAQADKLARIKQAEGSSQARQIEATGEAASRQKLADAEAYRLERVGKANSEQMAREGALITKHPLLIQKTVADKLSDKVQVIIAPPGTDGRFIAANLLGGGKAEGGRATAADEAEQ
jgi:regulator of protease activity HflC (stomatin/prohibitin superfamily)